MNSSNNNTYLKVNGSNNGGPTMKGNIGPAIKKNDTLSKDNKKIQKLAEEFDIDNVIPKDEQKNEVSQNFEPNDSMHSFELSIKNYDIDSNIASSER